MTMNVNGYVLRPRHARTNRAMGAIVDEAVTALPDVGVRRAAEFLASLGVPHEVAVRVLVYPHLRRS
jgi:hypothetical protein